MNLYPDNLCDYFNVLKTKIKRERKKVKQENMTINYSYVTN